MKVLGLLYQKLSKKVQELHVLGMPLKRIAQTLQISKNTVRRAIRYKNNPS